MALGGVEIGIDMPTEQAMATTTATRSGLTLSSETASDTARGTSRLAAAECEMTLARPKLMRPSVARIARPPKDV